VPELQPPGRSVGHTRVSHQNHVRRRWFGVPAVAYINPRPPLHRPSSHSSYCRSHHIHSFLSASTSENPSSSLAKMANVSRASLDQKLAVAKRCSRGTTTSCPHVVVDWLFTTDASRVYMMQRPPLLVPRQPL
jgi:hypothetical protein